MATVKYWVWLASLRGLTTRAERLVLEYFENPMEAYFCEYGEYGRIEGLTNKDRKLLASKNLDRAESILAACEEKNIRIMTMQDADYPQRLAHIYDPPVVLYVRGRVPVIDEEPAIAVVGTRKASAYGIKMAMRLGYDITKGGGLVISGLAAGVDAAAARGALNAGGACVGVLGSAIDVPYPSQNADLIEDVATAGALFSEYPPGYPTLGENFPRRNRILSGLSAGVAVVEAPRHSGALITADLALEQGRELFVVPGNADAPNCEGSNELLRDCAKAVSCGWDILCEFESRFPRRIVPEEGRSARLPRRREEKLLAFSRGADAPEEYPETVEKPLQPDRGYRGKSAESDPDGRPDTTKKEIDKEKAREYIDFDGLLDRLSENQLKLVSVMDRPQMHADELIARTGLSAAAVLSELTVLSIKGLVIQGKGKRYTLNLTKRGQ
jgi:DNA processing protein